MSLPVEVWLPAAMLALGVVTWAGVQLYRQFGPGTPEEKASREAMLATAVHFLHEGVAWLAPRTATKLDDYAEQALGVIEAKLADLGAKPMTPAEASRVRDMLAAKVLPGPQP